MEFRMGGTRELSSFDELLKRAPRVLTSEGRLASITFHSSEDRVVKWYGPGAAGEGVLKIITKKPLEPSEEEQRANPRSRSAKLRVFEKI